MLPVETIQLREGRWVFADLCGKGRRIRTLAVPIWVKQGINAWMTAAGIEDGRLLRRVTKAGKLQGDGLSDWTVWSVVKQAAKEIGTSGSERTTCGERAQSSAAKQEAMWNRSAPYSDTRRSRRRNGTLEANRSCLSQ